MEEHKENTKENGVYEEVYPRGKGKLVLIATDGSETSSKALQWALNNLVFRNAENDIDSDEIVLLHAQQIPPANCNPMGVTTSEIIESMKEKEELATYEIFERERKICEAYNVKVRTMVKTGDPRDHICETVEKLKADILIMGNHGHGRLKRVLLGSTSDYCVHHAKCDVVIAKTVPTDYEQ